MDKRQQKIEKLISELCPNGVEFLDIERLWIKAPKSKLGVAQVKELSEGNVICFTSGKNVFYVDDYLVDGEYIFMNDGGSADTKYNKGKAYYTDHTFTFTVNENKLLPKFTYYFLKENEIYINDILFKGTGLKNLNKKAFAKIKIPIPPLEIQEEIVKILDNFTALEAELEAELEARKKQYKYYINKLLDVKNADPKILGQILQRTKGTKITASQMGKIDKTGAPIKIFAGGKTVAHVEYGDIPEKDILTKESIVVKSRGIIEFEYINKPFSHKNEFWSYHCDSPDINIKYIYYYLKHKEPYFRSIGQRMSKMPQLSIPDTDKFIIPIPPLSEQNRIVSILDKFDALVNDLSIGLPAELKARRQQYEYYRNQLLTFKEYAPQ